MFPTTRTARQTLRRSQPTRPSVARALARRAVIGIASASTLLSSSGCSRQANAAFAPSPPPAPPGFEWVVNQVLSDEFNGSSLDSTKWIPYSPLWKGRLPSRFETGNVRVYGGNLELRGSLLVNSLADVRNIKKDIWIGAANVSSRSPSAFYGYYEARLKASRLSMTSAFWFQAERGPLDDISEIDVVEQFGSADSAAELGSYMRSNTHYFDHGWKNDRQTQFRVLMNSGAADQFHTYGVWWKNQDSVTFFLDGVEVRQVKTPKPFEWPMYLFFDTEPWSWAGFPSPSSLKDSSRNTMYVDWIRAWTLRPTSPRVKNPPTS